MTAAPALIAVLLGLVAACAAPAPPRPAPPPAAPGPPAGPPEGWSWVASDGDGLWVALPPWLPDFDTSGAVFANEVRPGPGLQLMAQGPRGVEPQPRPDELEPWLRERLHSPVEGLADTDWVELPSGSALHVERLDGAGTKDAWLIQAWAIRTPDGVAYLQVDGPPVAWAGREEDVGRIASLLTFHDPQGSTP